MISGLGIGGIWGLREGAKRPLVVSNARLRVNSILNSITRRATFMGNSAGVVGEQPALSVTVTYFIVRLALVYNVINSTLDSFRGKHDAFGGMAAGAITGALYKSTGMH